MTISASLADRAADHLQTSRRYHRPAAAGSITVAAALTSLSVPMILPFTAAAAAYTVLLVVLRARVAAKMEAEVDALSVAYGPEAAAAVCALPAPWWSQVPRGLDPAAAFAFLVAVARVHATTTGCGNGHLPLCPHRAPESVQPGTWVARVIALPAEVGLLAFAGPGEHQ